MSVVWVRDNAGWHDAFKSKTGLVGSDLNDRGRTLASLARTQVGKKSFRLVRSINSTLGFKSGELEVTVGSSVDYALLHHEGTKAHEIRARRAKRLRFVQNGVVRYAVAVHHPGTRPNRYLTDNLSKVIPA